MENNTQEQPDRLGETLRKVREHRRLSIKQVSEDIKARVKYLEYLEAGRYDLLPANVYVRGLVKNYAEYLGLPSNQAIRVYDRERLEMEVKNPKFIKKDKTAKINKSKIVITPHMFKIAIIVLLAVAVLAYLGYQVSGLVSAPYLEIVSPANDTTVSEESITVKGITEQETKVTINGEQVNIDDNGFFEISVNLQNGMNVLKFIATSKLDKTTEVTRNIIYQSGQQNKKDSEENSNNGASTNSQAGEGI